MRRIFLTSLVMMLFVSLYAQRNTTAVIEEIKNSGNYFYALGAVANSKAKAEDKALEGLYDNISGNGKFSLVKIDADDQDEYVTDLLLSLDVKAIKKILPVTGIADGYSYFAYVHKKDFDSICDRRANVMRRYAERARNKEDEQKMVEALKNYYWAMLLCVSHPQGATLQLDVDGKMVLAYNYLHERATEVLGMFDFAIAKDNPGEFNDEGLAVILNVRSFGEDVSGLKLDYYNGVDDYGTEKVSNGKAQLQLATSEIDEIDVTIKYDFQYELISHPEVKSVMDNIDNVILNENVTRKIELKKYLKYFKNYKEAALGTMAEQIPHDEKESDLLAMMQEIEAAFRTKNYMSVSKYFTREAFDMLDTLSANAKFTVVGNQQYEFVTLDNVTMCRDIDLKFHYKNSDPFIKEVVFRYDNEKQLITSLSFRLDKEAENDIMNKGRWPVECRYTLLNFMEDYQTAYALKRYDYLESIFSNDALIIVGHVLKRTVLPDQMQFNLSEEEVRLMEYDKQTYFNNLSRTFAAQEYIDIRFAETDFMRQMNSLSADNSGGEDIFGVRLLQEYNSTTYGDTGYLFLMVDLRDHKRPVIHVRAWQPDKVDMNRLVELQDLK